MRRSGVAIDVDFPAGQSRSQPRVLAFLADGERELIFVDGNLDALLFRIEHKVLHFRRLKRFEDELLRIGAPTNDVHLLVVQFANDVLYPRAAHADASADRIHFFIRARHRNLGSVTGFARNAADLDGAVVDLAHLELEQTPDEIRMAARDDDLRAADAVLHRDNIGAYPIPHVVILDDDTLALRHDRLEFSEIENHVGPIEPAYGPADDLAGAVLELLINHFLLDLPNALHHRLLRRLGRNPAKVLRRYFNFHLATDRGVRIDPLRLRNGNLVGRIRDVVDDEQLRQGPDLAGLRIDIDP